VLLVVPEFQGRVSPTFDFCHRVTLWRVDDHGCRRVGVRTCKRSTTAERVERLESCEAEVLLCGAIGDEAVQLLQARGIRVVMGVAGPVAQVVAAFACGALDDSRYRLPGFERGGSAAVVGAEG
jgi:predicted Fe-Mo cluster-binding NifX family protein